MAVLERVAVFYTHCEAQVAASALRADGVRAEVFDHFYLGANWLLIDGLGGIRVMAPAGQLNDARQILVQALSRTPDDLPGEDRLPKRQDGGWRLAAGLLFFTPTMAWSVLAIGRTRQMREKCMGSFLAAAATFAVIVVAGLFGRVLGELFVH